MKISCHTQTLPVAQLLSPSYSLLVCPSSCLEGREKWGGEQNFVLQSNMIHLYWGRSISRPLIDQLLPLVLFFVDVCLWLSLANTCNFSVPPSNFYFCVGEGDIFCFRRGLCLLRFIYSCNILPDLFSHPSFNDEKISTVSFLVSGPNCFRNVYFLVWLRSSGKNYSTLIRGIQPPYPTHFPTAPSTLESWEYLR